jgi:hypothetical protein
MTVVTLRREPYRAIVVRPLTGDRFAFQIAPMERRKGRKAATYMGHAFGAHDIEEALQCALRLRGKSGLPVVDLTRREPTQVAA